MSHVAYDLQWSSCLNDLIDQQKQEEIPVEKTSDNDGVSREEIFSHLACLYIKYIDVFTKLEDCYD